jgi:hypothetical protein
MAKSNKRSPKQELHELKRQRRIKMKERKMQNLSKRYIVKGVIAKPCTINKTSNKKKAAKGNQYELPED